jgi:hypothetical protein
MLIADAQRDSRTVYVGGFVGQLVSSIVWFASAVVAQFVDPVTGFWTLAVGGAAIFPLTQALLRMSGRPASLAPGNPLRGLAIQVAFTVPITLPVAAAAALKQPGWFYPACLVIVGAHYLPFVFLYGMRTFAALAAALASAGLAIGMMAPGRVVLGAWVGSAILFVFAFVLLAAYKWESSLEASTHRELKMGQVMTDPQ